MAVRTYSATDAYADAPEKKVTLYLLVLGFIALMLGTLMGPLQALNYGNVDVYKILQPILKSYYQGLTLHGVLNAIVFTQLFGQAILMYLPARELKMRPNMTLAWLAWWMAFIGLFIAALPILTNNASVLYTFYPPLKGHWAFYVGAAIFVLSSWVSIFIVWSMWRQWKRANPGQITPLVTFMSLMTWLMWFLASLGLVVEVAVFLIPWSLGLIAGVDPLLARTLFWFSGHAIVYFWLLPAFTLVYALLPRLAGGKLVSDSLTRLVFVMFLLFSVPVGFHHQFADPGVSVGWKMFHTILTMMVAVPSIITAFTIAASLENAGRNRGGKGLLGWIPALPWNNPTVLAFLLALISNIPGGAGGFVNASFPLDQVVHNTVWIVGHLHLPVATVVTMIAMGAAYLLVPHLTGKPLVGRGFAIAANWLWFVGMNIMAFALHWMGYFGVPRRAHISELPLSAYGNTQLYQVLNVIAGIILFIAAVFFFYVLYATLLGKRQVAPAATPEVPFSEVLSGPKGNALASLTDQVGLWFGLAVVLIVIAYAVPLFQMFTHINPVPGMRLW